MEQMEEAGTTERVALAVWLLLQAGDGLTVNDLADRLRMTPRGARMMLCRVSSVLPIRYDYERRLWVQVDGDWLN